MELPINKYYIEEIKYRLNDNKSVIFKMNNFMLKDVEIINETTELTKDDNPSRTNEEIEETLLNGKPKELHDYVPFSCLITEAGMQEALNASRKKEWKNNFNKKEIAEYSSLAEKMLETANTEKNEEPYQPATQDEIEDYKSGKYSKITYYLNKKVEKNEK